MTRESVAIAGVGTTAYTRDSGTTVLDLAVQACSAAISDAGLTVEDIDGIVTYQLGDSPRAVETAAAMGMDCPGWYSDFYDGGAGLATCVVASSMAIDSGAAKRVVLFRALNGRTGQRFGRFGAEASAANWQQWTLPFGLATPPQFAALWAQRHAALYGTTSQQLGLVAVTLRQNANLNPQALFYQRTLSLEEHQASRVISSPLRLFDCCLESDGAAAVVLTTTSQASDLKHEPVILGGYAIGRTPAHSYPPIDWPDHTTTFVRHLVDRAFKMANVELGDVSFLELYDPFTIFVLTQLEDLGYCEKGEAGAFVADGHIARTGRVPVNLNGGLLSEAYVHGLNNLVEAVRQLRHEAGERQVPNAQVGLVTAGEGERGGVLVFHR